MGSILDVLKARTRDQHEGIERQLAVPERLESVDAYVQLIEAFYGYYAPLEADLAKLVATSPIELELAPRWKAPLLLADLHCWSIPTANLAVCRSTPSILSHATAFGCMYVLEGATLGGQIIKRLLNEKLSITPENGGSFFSAYGDRVGAMWGEFRAALADYADRHLEQQELIVASASETFLTLSDWMKLRLPSIRPDS